MTKKIDDTGMYIPNAKKHHGDQPQGDPFDITTPPVAPPVPPTITLKKLWPEPKWQEIFDDGCSRRLLADLYSIYHSIAKEPPKNCKVSFGRRETCFVTDEMWEKAYVESIDYIKQGWERASSIQELDAMENHFKSYFTSKYGEDSHYHYACGQRTPKTFYSPFTRSGRAAQYKHFLPHLPFPESVNPKKIKVFPVEFTDSATRKKHFKLCKVNKKSIIYDNSGIKYKNAFRTYEEAAEAFRRTHLDECLIPEDQRKDEEGYRPLKPETDELGVLENTPNVTPEVLLSKYGIRGLQFGNYVPQSERQMWLNNTDRAFMLMSDLLNIPHSWIGGKALALAFGARGERCSAAHYEPVLHVINFTRFNGAGSIAHEFMHSFDSRLARIWCNQKHQFLSDLIVDHNASLVVPKYSAQLEAFKNLLRVIYSQRQFMKNANELEENYARFSYWAQPCELIARAFEAFVQDELNNQSITHQWLALGTLESDYPSGKPCPYPQGIERDSINNAFREMFAHIFSEH